MKTLLYEKLVTDLTDKIKTNRLAAGQRIPSEKELCGLYRVSSITVKRAMRELSQKGLVIRRPKLGTFVASEGGEATAERVVPKKIRSLVFVASFLNDELISNVVHGLSLEGAEHGAHLIVKSSLNDEAKEEEIIRSLPDMDIDGAVILPIGSQRNAETYFSLKLRYRIPFVFVDRYYEGLDVPHVVTDDVDAGYKLTTWLYDRGHRRVAFIGEALSMTPARLRHEGYVRALYDRGLRPDGALLSLVLPYLTPEGQERDLEPERDGYRRLLTLADRPTAVVAINNYYAYNFIQVAQEMGLRVPEDISVVGVGGKYTAHRCRPQLTFMRQDFERMGHEAFRVLQTYVANDGKAEHSVIPAILEPGQSAAPVAGSGR